MNKKRKFSTEEARSIGTQLKLDWSQIDLEQFRGLELKLEHGAMDPETDVTSDDVVNTGKIAWALAALSEPYQRSYSC